MRTGVRWILRISILLLVCLAAIVAFFLGLSHKDSAEDFARRKGVLKDAVIEPYSEDSLSRKSWLTVTSTSGLKVVCGLLMPREKRGPLPAVIVLGGKATGRYAVDYALGVNDVIIVAPDYPYEPRATYTPLNFLADVPAIRMALFDMVPSVWLVTDYLWQRGDIDTSKIVIMGYSFGAPFVPAIVSGDHRAAIAVVVYGGGELTSLIRHNVRRYEGPVMSEFVGQLSGLLLRPLEPLRYAGDIAPTPLLMINGTNDEQIPRENTLLLFHAAREPKEIVWLESSHVHPRNVDLTKRIIRTVAERLQKKGILPMPQEKGMSIGSGRH